MNSFKRVARLAAGALLVTGIFASSAAPAGAAADHANANHARMSSLDTGWGG
jgi:hypothetical protein